MAILMHLTPEKDADRIVRRGLRASRLAGPPHRGLFCIPLLPNYFASHQWLRELRRRGARTFVAIDFRVRATEPVYVGHYGHEHVATTVGRAVRVLQEQADPRGWELILPRSVDADEIVNVRAVSRVVGWRYYPGAHGPKPCACDYCTKGLFGSRRLRQRLDPPEPKRTKPMLFAELEQAIASGDEAAIDEAISWLVRLRDRATRRRLRALLEHPLPLVRRLVAEQLPE
jgi:hypothetical protein